VSPRLLASRHVDDGPGPAQVLRVLVVDDEPDTVQTLLEILRAEGYDVRGHASAAEALKGIEEFDPDVVISDIAMPLMSGWDIATRVRVTLGMKKRPLLVAITGRYTKTSDRMLSNINGFDYHLTKPCDPQVLIDLVEKAKYTR
jgi:DNA-binding response OmpR family regulator